MPVRIKSKRPRHRHFIKEWREFRRLTQQQLADRMGASKATISRIEASRQPYTQDFLELCADVLLTDPISLLTHAPDDMDAIWPIWGRAPAGQRKEIVKAAKKIIRAST